MSIVYPDTWTDPIAGTPEERARTIGARMHAWCRLNSKPDVDVEYQAFLIGLIARVLGDDDNARLRSLAPDLADALDKAHIEAGALEHMATLARNEYVVARNRQLALQVQALESLKDVKQT